MTWHFTLALHLNVTRRRFLKNFGETFKKIWSNLRLRLGKKSIRYVTLHLIEGDACVQLRSVTEIASKSPFDMWPEILSGMIFVPALLCEYGLNRCNQTFLNHHDFVAGILLLVTESVYYYYHNYHYHHYHSLFNFLFVRRSFNFPTP